MHVRKTGPTLGTCIIMPFKVEKFRKMMVNRIQVVHLFKLCMNHIQ